MRAAANGIEIEYETFGDPADPPLLVVAGLGCQLKWWSPDFLQGFVDRGFYVIIFDNRDVGLSTKIDTPIDLISAVESYLQGNPVDAPYQLSDMASDAWGLCDVLGLDRVHIMGASMGGMIVQQMTIDRPERVASITSIMSTTGEPDVGQPTAEAIGVLLEPAPTEREANLANSLIAGRLLAGPVYCDEDWILERNTIQFDRCFNPDGQTAQLLAIVTSPPRSERLRLLEVSALVIHGDIDPLVTLSGGERTAESLRGSEFLVLENMGHDVPRQYWATIIEHVTALAARANA
ncbi:MAG: alpha/beta hydrolase [Acidimicrobiales bacterium]